MSIADICVRDVDVVKPTETAWQAAVRMRQRAVGTLVVVNSAKRPIGIVTDRDLMERVVAEDRDARNTLIETVMTRDPMTIVKDESVQEALVLMRHESLRRLPVVDSTGLLVGLVSMDDILMHLSDAMEQIGQLVRRETPQSIANEPAWSRWE